MAKYIICFDIDAKSHEDVYEAIDRILDDGAMQSEIQEHVIALTGQEVTFRDSSMFMGDANALANLRAFLERKSH